MSATVVSKSHRSSFLVAIGTLILAVAAAGTSPAASGGPPYDEGRANCAVNIEPVFTNAGCPASRSTPLGHAAANAWTDVEAGHIAVSASAGGSPVSLKTSAGSTAIVISLRTTTAAGVVRAVVTGIWGATLMRCPRCVSAVEGGYASAGLAMTVQWSADGETHSDVAMCSLSFDGSPAPASIVIPDGCQPYKTISVPPGTAVSIGVALVAIVGVSGRARASASMQATVSRIEVP